MGSNAEYRARNIEHIREYKRQWRAANPDSTKRYYLRRREKVVVYNAQYGSQWPEKIKAVRILNHALRDGDIIRPLACNHCNKTCKPQAHHSDYSKPLEVVWVCASCHKLIHL